MSETNSQPSGPGWFGRVMLFILRLVLVVIIGLGIGVGLYMGGMYLANRYFQSVQVNSERIQALEDGQAVTEEQIKGRIDDLAGRVQVVEKANDTRGLSEDEMESRLAALETSQPALSVAQDTAAQQAAQISTLEARIANLQATQQAQAASAAELGRVNATQDAALATLSADWSAANAAAQSAAYEVELLKAAQSLARARFNLYQNNLGLAQQDLQTARRILLAARDGAAEHQAAALAGVINRLEAVEQRLPAAPVAASDQLEDAWSLLLAQLEPAQEEPLPPILNAAATATPTPTPKP